FFFSSRRRHTRFSRDWSSDVCSSDLEDEFQSRLLRAAEREARDNGLDFLAVGGGVLGREEANPKSFIYDLVSPRSVDALLIATHVIGHHSTLTEVRSFVERYAPLPRISLGVELEG